MPAGLDAIVISSSTGDLYLDLGEPIPDLILIASGAVAGRQDGKTDSVPNGRPNVRWRHQDLTLGTRSAPARGAHPAPVPAFILARGASA